VAAPLGVLDLSNGRCRDTFERLAPITREDRLALGTIILADFIEAAARSGQHSGAVAALDRLTARATAGDGRVGLGRLARCQALLAPDDEAEGQYRRSIEMLSSTNSSTELGRSRLVYGEWLRRQRRRREVRDELSAAFDAFADMGAQGFAERAWTELEATGAQARARRAETSPALTAQETQVARLAVEGGTNREVAAKLFISPATVEYHLRHIFQKLGVSSRAQLTRKISQAEQNAVLSPVPAGRHSPGRILPQPAPIAKESAPFLAAGKPCASNSSRGLARQ
jgi:DNA-binding CsgD family transcriptional regulator